MAPHKDEVKTETASIEVMKQKAGPHCISSTHNNLPVHRVGFRLPIFSFHFLAFLTDYVQAVVAEDAIVN